MPNDYAKESYKKKLIKVIAVRRDSIEFSANIDGVEGTSFIGKGALNYLSLEMVEKYMASGGALPMEFSLEIPTWLTSKWAKSGIAPI